MPTDLELVQQFQREHDQAAFDQLVERHSDRAFQLAYSILQNRQDAEEVVQDAFIRIYRSLGNFRGDAQFSTWMYRIVVNLCNNKFRWNKVRGANCTISIDAPLPNAEGDEDLRLLTCADENSDAFGLGGQYTKTAGICRNVDETAGSLLVNCTRIRFDDIIGIENDDGVFQREWIPDPE